MNWIGTVSNCYATSSVTGGDYSESLGGLCGINTGSISNCYTTGSVTGGDYSERLGGLCGGNSGTIRECYATATVMGGAWVGGLVGENDERITNCYATGNVSGGYRLGGLVGHNWGSISNSFWDVESSGLAVSTGGFGRTTAQMQTSGTFVGWGNGIWAIAQGEHPHLAWENAGGETIDNIPERTYSGSGTPTDPFILDGPNDLLCLVGRQQDWDACFDLAGDIDMNGVSDYLPPGEFTGKMDGKGFTMFDLTINEPGGSLLGLIGYLGPGGKLLNLVLENVHINGHAEMGGLVGFNCTGSSISDCRATGSLSGEDYLGGLCGVNFNGTISKCCASGSVTGDDYLGGLCGRSEFGTISDCYATGSVTGGVDSYCLGGLVGFNNSTISNCQASASLTGERMLGGLVGQNNRTVSNCCASASVSGDEQVGGLVGWNHDWGNISNSYSTGSTSVGDDSREVGGLVGDNWGLIENCYSTSFVTGGDYSDYLGGLSGKNSGTIENCHATGSVSGGTGSEHLGGLVGYDGRGSYTSCFWDATINPDVNGIGNTTDPNVIGKTTGQMQIISTFTNAGWDFVGETANGTECIWRICVDGVTYPLLWWQFTQGDFVCPDGVDFVDFRYFSERWGDEYCYLYRYCDAADLDFSGKVHWPDLKIFCDHWLEGY
jgi:hypothetical protein